jgi:hypothetical protein
MRIQAVLAALVAGALCLGCGNDPVGIATEADIENHTGTIQRVGTFGYAIVDDATPDSRFAPSNLPASFKRDGLRVLFSGKRGVIPPNVRMWGAPLELTSIQLDRR